MWAGEFEMAMEHLARGSAGMRYVVQRLLIALVLSGSACGQSAAAEPPTEQRLRQWVKNLDADDYQVREQATKRLIRAGAAAVPLVAGDPEVVMFCM